MPESQQEQIEVLHGQTAGDDDKEPKSPRAVADKTARQQVKNKLAAADFRLLKLPKELRLANNRLIDSVRPEITGLGNEFAKAFANLHARHLDFDQYIDDLESVGASVGQFRIRPNGLLHPRDLSGGHAYGLNEFIDAGFFSKSNMPKALK